MNQKTLDLRGKEFSFDFPQSHVFLEGVRFTRLLTQKAFVRASVTEESVDIIFQRPGMESFNEQAITIAFRGLKGKDFPPTIVDPVHVGIYEVFNQDNLAEVVLAQFGKVKVSQEKEKIVFSLDFNGKVYSKKYCLTSKSPPFHVGTLGSFFSFC